MVVATPSDGVPVDIVCVMFSTEIFSNAYKIELMFVVIGQKISPTKTFWSLFKRSLINE